MDFSSAFLIRDQRKTAKALLIFTVIRILINGDFNSGFIVYLVCAKRYPIPGSIIRTHPFYQKV